MTRVEDKAGPAAWPRERPGCLSGRRLGSLGALGFALLPLASLGATPPQPAPPVYATANYGLTFRSPPGTTYCPLPRRWVGSDHGTILFLEPPRHCGGADYPSIGRGFAPANAARLELYYGFYDATDSPGPAPCREIGRLAFLGRDRPLCRADRDGMIAVSVRAAYGADGPAEAVLTLATRPDRLEADLGPFRRLAASLRTCTPLWRRAGRGRESGPPCARSGWF